MAGNSHCVRDYAARNPDQRRLYGQRGRNLLYARSAGRGHPHGLLRHSSRDRGLLSAGTGRAEGRHDQNRTADRPVVAGIAQFHLCANHADGYRDRMQFLDRHTERIRDDRSD